MAVRFRSASRPLRRIAFGALVLMVVGLAMTGCGSDDPDGGAAASGGADLADFFRFDRSQVLQVSPPTRGSG